ncbi:hypothetical protein ACFVSN_30055 [Kitasatospora sp. NPDC057904]
MQRWWPSASLLHSNGDAMDIAVSDGRTADGPPRHHRAANELIPTRSAP